MQSQSAFDIFSGGRNPAISESVMAVTAVPSAAMPKTDVGGYSQAPSIATDYSKTNNQVEGVDEADFVKNDGKYIYAIAQNNLIILDAFPASNATIISSTLLDGNPKEIFVNGDRLMVFMENTDRVYGIPEYDYIPRPRDTLKTVALV